MSAGKSFSMGKALFGGGLTVAFGYAIMKMTTPTDEEFYNKLSPDLKKQVDAQRQAANRKAAVTEQLERAKLGEDSAPVWAAGADARDSSPPPRR